MTIRVGFIGLGNQGKPIAAHLAPAGLETTVRGHMNIAEQDLAWALQLARKSGVSLPVGGLVSQSMADDQRR